MRPKFTLTNLLLLTAIVAMGTQMYRNHIQFGELEAELDLHKMVQAQTNRVRKCELDLQAATNQVKSEAQVIGSYQWVGFDDQLPENTTDSADDRSAIPEFSVPIGTRRKLLYVRDAELQLALARSRLQDLELELSKHDMD